MLAPSAKAAPLPGAYTALALEPAARRPSPSRHRPASRSSPARSTFFFAHYNQVKTISPNFGFQIRHADADPYMVIAYDFGETAKVPLAGLQAGDIARKVRAGSAPPRAPHFSSHTYYTPTPPPLEQLEQAIAIGADMPRAEQQSGQAAREHAILPAVVD